jgi:hypothetical protein
MALPTTSLSISRSGPTLTKIFRRLVKGLSCLLLVSVTRWWL